MVNAMIQHFSNGNKTHFANKIKVTPQTISTWIARNTFDIERVFTFCEGISARWLLSGEGDILEKSAEPNAPASADERPTGADMAYFDRLIKMICELSNENKDLKAEIERLRGSQTQPPAVAV